MEREATISLLYTFPRMAQPTRAQKHTFPPYYVCTGLCLHRTRHDRQHKQQTSTLALHNLCCERCAQYHTALQETRQHWQYKFPKLARPRTCEADSSQSAPATAPKRNSLHPLQNAPSRTWCCQRPALPTPGWAAPASVRKGNYLPCIIIYYSLIATNTFGNSRTWRCQRPALPTPD